MGILILPGDEERGAQRLARLIGRYAERFEPPSRVEFYASLAAKIGRLRVRSWPSSTGTMCPKNCPTVSRSQSIPEGQPDGKVGHQVRGYPTALSSSRKMKAMERKHTFPIPPGFDPDRLHNG